MVKIARGIRLPHTEGYFRRYTISYLVSFCVSTVPMYGYESEKMNYINNCDIAKL